MKYPDMLSPISDDIEIALESLKHKDLINIEKISHSTSTYNYKMTFKNQEPLHLRVYRPRVDPTYEYFVLENIYSEGIWVPEPLYKKHLKKTQSFIIGEFIEGPILGELFFTNEKIDHLLSAYIHQLHSIHQLNWREVFPNSKVSHYEKDQYQFNKELYNRVKRGAKQFNIYKQNKPIMTWIKNNIKSTKTTELHLLHADYHPFNNIVRDDKLVTVDWEAPEIGDNRYDLAFALLTCGVINGVKTENQLLELYKQSNLPINDMDYYYVTSALPRIVKLKQLINQAEVPEAYNLIHQYLIERVEGITNIELNLE